MYCLLFLVLLCGCLVFAGVHNDANKPIVLCWLRGAVLGSMRREACMTYRPRGLTTTASYRRTKFSKPISVGNILICDVGLRDTVVGVGNVDSY